MTAQLARLEPSEPVTFDQGKLSALCQAQGPHAENTIALTLTEIEALIAGLPDKAGHDAVLRRTCVDLVYLADSIGMQGVAGTSRAILNCLDRADGIALLACLYRLRRLGRPSDLGALSLSSGDYPETVA